MVCMVICSFPGLPLRKEKVPFFSESLPGIADAAFPGSGMTGYLLKKIGEAVVYAPIDLTASRSSSSLAVPFSVPSASKSPQTSMLR